MIVEPCDYGSQKRCRIRGEKPAYPQHNSESFPPAPSPTGLQDTDLQDDVQDDAQDWDRLRKRFADLLSDFATLANSAPQEMQRQIETVHEADKKVDATLEAVLWQMVAHNSYHVGQIAMIRRALGAWPPRGGGDTW